MLTGSNYHVIKAVIVLLGRGEAVQAVQVRQPHSGHGPNPESVPITTRFLDTATL